MKAELKNGDIAKGLSDTLNRPNIFKLAYDNGAEELQPHLDKFITLVKKYKGVNTTL